MCRPAAKLAASPYRSRTRPFRGRSRRSATTRSATSGSGPSGRCGGTRSCRSRSCSSIRGWVYEDSVTIHEITPEGVREIAFDPEAFDYGKNKIDRDEPAGAGLRRFPRALPGQHADLQGRGPGVPRRQLLPRARTGPAVRALGARPGHRHRARTPARNFPRFVEFWIERPKPARQGAHHLRPARFAPRGRGLPVRRSGRASTTVLDVDARLFLRKNVAKLGLAPLTSMFFFGANQRAAREDYRPRVHDSDGLSIQAANRRVDLAPAGESQAAAGDVVRAERSARLRPDAARRGRSAATRTSRRATTCAPRPGSSRRGRGGPAGWSWCRSRCPTRPTTTSWRTGSRLAAAAEAAGARVSVLWQDGSPPPCWWRDAPRPRIRRRGWQRRAHVDFEVRRSAAARPRLRRRRSVDPNGESWSDTSERSHRGLAPRRAIRRSTAASRGASGAPERRQARSCRRRGATSCRPTRSDATAAGGVTSTSFRRPDERESHAGAAERESG